MAGVREEVDYFVIHFSDGDADIYLSRFTKKDILKYLNQEEVNEQLDLDLGDTFNVVNPGFAIGGKEVIIKGVQVYPKEIETVTRWEID